MVEEKKKRSVQEMPCCNVVIFEVVIVLIWAQKSSCSLRGT
jgi:hypothetical protein